MRFTRWLTPIDAAGLSGVLGYALLAYESHRSDPSLVIFFGIVVGIALLTLGIYIHQPRSRFTVSRVLLWALLFRGCAALGQPLFEDDFYRYLWDGYRFATAGSPYGLAPEAFFTDATVPFLFHRILDQVNYPEVPTIYGPTLQYLFLTSYFIMPGSVKVLQLLLIGIDIILIGLLFKLAPARQVLLYAWNPLVIKEIALTAHPDGLGVCLLIAAVLFQRHQKFNAAALCLAFGVAAKVFALLLVPFVLAAGRWRHYLLFASTVLLLYGPFWYQGSSDMTALSLFARSWEFNSALFGLFTLMVSAMTAKVILGSGFLLFLIAYYIYYRQHPHLVRGDWIYGLLLLIAPVINAWYWLWVLPFAVIYPSVWAWSASIALLLSYITALNLGDFSVLPYQQPVWARWLEWSLIGIAVLIDSQRRRLNKVN
ncbi:MAG: hypothetical protein SVR94_05700 [Pseudomonadota bacterium]|nr:hypothetical protein [Pseudomonadota bacterium]